MKCKECRGIGTQDGIHNCPICYGFGSASFACKYLEERGYNILNNIIILYKPAEAEKLGETEAIDYLCDTYGYSAVVQDEYEAELNYREK